VIISLDPPKQGGETRFEKVDLNVKLDQGDALLFYNRFPNGTVDPLTLHSGLPVLEGEKWIITKWIRERPYNNSWYSKELNRAKPNPNAVNPFTGLPDGQ
jgi:prolyl 4-hydroxylase